VFLVNGDGGSHAHGPQQRTVQTYRANVCIASYGETLTDIHVSLPPPPRASKSQIWSRDSSLGMPTG
jgi:hypothetical protein